MPDSLYHELSDLRILKRAWHLARNDTRTDFVEDPFRYNDFAFNLDKNLEFISHSLKNEEFHPSPLLHIDIPKSTLSVRPVSIICMKDRIVLFCNYFTYISYFR